jgi:RHS repeat-associated protein
VTGDSKTLSDGIFPPPEEQMPVPPPSMYRGITTLITRYLYTGREYNIETGMYYYRARINNPGHGRFTGKDRIKYINLYEYLYNNPMIYRDYWGLSPSKCNAMYARNEALNKMITDLEANCVNGCSKGEKEQLDSLKETRKQNAKDYEAAGCGTYSTAEDMRQSDLLLSLLGGYVAPALGFAIQLHSAFQDYGSNLYFRPNPPPLNIPHPRPGEYAPEHDTYH